MYAIAIIGDLFSLIPGVNIVSNFITMCLLALVGSHEGVNIYSSDNIGGTLGVIVLETVPGISMIPAWTIRVYFAKQAAKDAA